MQIPYTDTIFIGIIRLFFWLLFFYVVKRLFFRSKKSLNQVNSMAYLWSLYFSIVLVLIFVLIQIDSYDLMTCVMLLVLFFGFRLVGLKNIFATTNQFVRKKKAILLSVIENIEDKEPIIDIVEEKPSKRLNVNYEFLVAVLVSVTALLVRFYLMRYDNYELSPSWFKELSIIKGFSNQNWFNTDLTMMGEYAIVSFYSKFTGISPEIALESFGMIQGYILCFVIFWFMNMLTSSKITVPLISALSFAVFFNLAPLNISQVAHSKSTLIALSLALPAMIYIRRPWVLYKRNPKAYMFGMLMIFMAIALIDLFTLLILLPPIFVITPFFLRNKYKSFYWKSLFAYIISSTIVLCAYALACNNHGYSFATFVLSNLISVTASTTTSNMIIPYRQLLMVVQVLSGITLLIMFLLFRKNRLKWTSSMVFLIYTNVLISLTYINTIYLDNDLFNEVLPVFISISLGIFVYMILYFFITQVKRVSLTEEVAVPLIFLIFLPIAYFTQKDLFYREEETPRLRKEILEAYEKISSSYLAYSYAVVNSDFLQPISDNSHNFITYDNFLNNYPTRDSVYFANKENKAFLAANTQFIIPNSLLVFVYENPQDSIEPQFISSVDQVRPIRMELENLKRRGREIRVFYKSDHFSVYEVVNNPKLSKIEEML